MSIKVIFDTDPGIDDAFALFYALSHPEIEVIGITTVFGNVPIDISTNNAYLLKEKSESNIQVFKGASKPLLRPNGNFPYFIHGDDGLGNINHARPKNIKENIEASDFIIDSAYSYPGEINIIAIGPLTNIANVINKDPKIWKIIKSITIMGGSWFAGGNISPVAEANIYNDPEAADVVFKSKIPITMIGLDVTHKVFLTNSHIKYLASLKNNSGKFLQDISNFYVEFYKETKNMNGCYFHDATAAIAFTNPEYFDFKKGKVFVSQDRLTRGQTVVFESEKFHETFIDDKRKNINIANKVRSKKVISKFLEIAEKYMK